MVKRLFNDLPLLNKLFFFNVLMMTSLMFSSCNYYIYSDSVGNSILSFEYSNKDYIFPYSLHYTREPSPLPPKLSSIDSTLISISTFTAYDLETHIEGLVSDMQEKKGISYFEVTERGTTEIDGMMVDYIKYGYDSYDTTAVSYQGIFLSFVYKGFIIDIDILSQTGSLAGEEAFTRIIKTFKIED